MPLIKPKSQRDAEVQQDKPSKHSIGIALQIQQQNKKKKSMHTRPDMSLSMDDDRPTSIADAIVKKKAKMADGGQVADTSDDLDMDALGKENYDDTELTDIEEQPEPTDMISRIRAKMNDKKGQQR